MAIKSVTDLDEEAPAQVLYNPHSEYGKEMRKWEQFPSWYTPPGTKPGNPYVYRPYPKAMYRAIEVKGKIRCFDANVDPYAFTETRLYEAAVQEMEALNARCFKTVGDEDAERIAKNDGWRNSPLEAIEALKERRKEVGNEAAEREYRDRLLSDNAKAEVRAYEESTHEHVAEVPSERERKRK